MTDSLVNQRAHVTYTWQLDCPNAGMDVITHHKVIGLELWRCKKKKKKKVWFWPLIEDTWDILNIHQWWGFERTSQWMSQIAVWPSAHHRCVVSPHKPLMDVCAGSGRKKSLENSRASRLWWSLLTRLNLSLAGPVSASSFVLGFIFKISPVVVPR